MLKVRRESPEIFYIYIYIYIYIFTVLIEARVWTSDSEVVGIVSPSR